MKALLLERATGQPASEFGPALAEALHVSKLVVTKGVPPDEQARPFWDTVSESIGQCVLFAEDEQGRKLGDKWMEIRYDPRFPNAYRHSKNAQPLHTDCSYIAAAPEVVFFYCVSQARAGGETTFIDSVELVDLLEQKDRGLLAALQSTPVLFSKVNDQRREKIIDEDDEGLRLNWNYYCVDRGEPADVKDLAERFHTFLESQVVREQRTLPVRLEPGQAVFFFDERLLHGRNAFAADETSERFFWKTAFTLHDRLSKRRRPTTRGAA